MKIAENDYDIEHLTDDTAKLGFNTSTAMYCNLVYNKGERITHIKVTGGSLKVKDTISINDKNEKINNIRVYSGEKFTTIEEATSGGVYALTGLNSVNTGDGLGFENSFGNAFLEPVMNYRIVLPKDCDPKTFFPKLKELEAEDPQLHITWNTYLQEIYVSLMGDVQTEILKSIISARFNVEVEIDIKAGYIASVNNPEMYKLVRNSAVKVLGEEKIVDYNTPTLGVEDFSYFCQAVKGCYYLFGVKNEEKGWVNPLHNDKFIADIEGIICDIAVKLQIAKDFLEQE